MALRMERETIVISLSPTKPPQRPLPVQAASHFKAVSEPIPSSQSDWMRSPLLLHLSFAQQSDALSKLLVEPSLFLSPSDCRRSMSLRILLANVDRSLFSILSSIASSQSDFAMALRVLRLPVTKLVYCASGTPLLWSRAHRCIAVEPGLP